MKLVALVLVAAGLWAARVCTAQDDPLSVRSSEKELLGQVIDRWHRAAAEADEHVFFGLMAEDAVYIGTEAGERWVKPVFKEWSAPYFDRESAWAFTSTRRQIYLSADGTVAWWEELLDTWMGVCAGSGVLEKGAEGWKIKHYHLSVTVPNDLIQDFMDLVSKYQTQE